MNLSLFSLDKFIFPCSLNQVKFSQTSVLSFCEQVDIFQINRIIFIYIYYIKIDFDTNKKTDIKPTPFLTPLPGSTSLLHSQHLSPLQLL